MSDGERGVHYDELADAPVRRIWIYLVLATVMTTVAVILLLTSRRGNVPQRAVTWPETRTGTILGLLGGAASVVALGLFWTSRTLTCGGQELRAGDRCLDLSTGTEQSRSDRLAAPAEQMWFWCLLAGLLVVVAVLGLIRRRAPTVLELEDYNRRMAEARAALLAGSPRVGAKHSSGNIAVFDDQLVAVLDRASRRRRPPETTRGAGQ